MSNQHHKTANLLHCALWSALVMGILGAIVVLIFMPAALASLPDHMANAITAEGRAVLVVAFPFAFAVMGFGLGTLMAFLHNMFHKPEQEPVEEPRVETATAA